jgi:hypothetical protein
LLEEDQPTYRMMGLSLLVPDKLSDLPLREARAGRSEAVLGLDDQKSSVIKFDAAIRSHILGPEDMANAEHPSLRDKKLPNALLVDRGLCPRSVWRGGVQLH